MVAVTTEREATLTARFDMLFTPPMKEYVKKKGGGSYLRDLVVRDVALQLSNLALTDEERINAQAALNAEMERVNG